MHCDYVTVKVVKISSGHVRTCHIQDIILEEHKYLIRPINFVKCLGIFKHHN